MAVNGADAPALFGFASEVRRRRAAIQDAMTRLGREVAEANWVGPDRDQFVEEWNGTHVPSLSGVLGDLEQAAQRAIAHATAQQEASS